MALIGVLRPGHVAIPVFDLEPGVAYRTEEPSPSEAWRGKQTRVFLESQTSTSIAAGCCTQATLSPTKPPLGITRSCQGLTRGKASPFFDLSASATKSCFGPHRKPNEDFPSVFTDTGYRAPGCGAR